jgi:sulfur carrier protein
MCGVAATIDRSCYACVMAFQLFVNGQERAFEELSEPVTLQRLIDELHLKSDRIAVERNGSIVERRRWAETQLTTGDRLEVVHFVGGGIG